MCKSTFTLVDSNFANIMLGCILPNLNADYPLVNNNAIWTLGELVLQAGGSFIGSRVNEIVPLLIHSLHVSAEDENLQVNIGITLGRLAIVNTEEMCLLLDEIFADWCQTLQLYCPPTEKYHAFKGLLKVLMQTPEVVLGNKSNIYSLLSACIAWPSGELPPGDIVSNIREILIGLQNNDRNLWNKVITKFEGRDRLANLYKIAY